MACVTLARNAMASRFELVMHGDDPVRLQAAGEQALDEIDRSENQLSLYRPQSEIARLNRRAAHEPVKVTPGLFALLEKARALAEETGGAFDITIAPLVRCWGFHDGNGALPDQNKLAEARANVGMHLLELNRTDLTVKFTRAGVMLDLGAIGKGYAIEQAMELLREAGVTSALLHGGTSSVYGLGQPPETDCWRVAIEHPIQPDSPPLATISLRDEALSVSAVWGKAFQSGGRTYGHVLDPRTGEPAANAVLAAVVVPSATESDALSTALLTMGIAGMDAKRFRLPEISTLVLFEAEGRLGWQTNGIEVHLPGS